MEMQRSELAACWHYRDLGITLWKMSKRRRIGRDEAYPEKAREIYLKNNFLVTSGYETLSVKPDTKHFEAIKVDLYRETTPNMFALQANSGFHIVQKSQKVN
jgi:hypothetical protein